MFATAPVRCQSHPSPSSLASRRGRTDGADGAAVVCNVSPTSNQTRAIPHHRAYQRATRAAERSGHSVERPTRALRKHNPRLAGTCAFRMRADSDVCRYACECVRVCAKEERTTIPVTLISTVHPLVTFSSSRKKLASKSTVRAPPQQSVHSRCGVNERELGVVVPSRTIRGNQSFPAKATVPFRPGWSSPSRMLSIRSGRPLSVEHRSR